MNDSIGLGEFPTKLIRIHQKILDEFPAYYIEDCMDDSEYIRIVRVLISAAVIDTLERFSAQLVEAQLRSLSPDPQVGARFRQRLKSMTRFTDESRSCSGLEKMPLIQLCSFLRLQRESKIWQNLEPLKIR